MPSSPIAFVDTPLWYTFSIVGAVTTTIEAAVLVKVKALAAAYRMPSKNQTAGDVVNGSIVVDPMQSVSNNNAISYLVSIRWQQWATPVSA